MKGQRDHGDILYWFRGLVKSPKLSPLRVTQGKLWAERRVSQRIENARFFVEFTLIRENEILRSAQNDPRRAQNGETGNF